MPGAPGEERILFNKILIALLAVLLAVGTATGETSQIDLDSHSNLLLLGQEFYATTDAENTLCLAADSQEFPSTDEQAVVEPDKSISTDSESCIGKYCMSLFTKTRTSKTVGKGRLSVAVKYQYIDYDDKKGSDDRYHDLGSDHYRKSKAVMTFKYGWAEDHHLGLCVPYMWNDFDVSGKINDSQDFGNIALFEKWNLIKETQYIPGVAVDLWYYFPTGNTDRKLGSSEYSWKVTAEISKAWPEFSVHLNPVMFLPRTARLTLRNLTLR